MNVCWLFSVLYLLTCLTWHVLWWSLQVSIRQTLVLHSGYVVETACELYTVLLSEKHIDVGRGYSSVNVCWLFSVLYLPTCLTWHVLWWSLQVSIRQTLVLHSGYVVETACELYTVLPVWEAHWCWQGYSSVNVCWLFSVLYSPTCLTWHVLWWSLQVSIRQTLVLPEWKLARIIIAHVKWDK